MVEEKFLEQIRKDLKILIDQFSIEGILIFGSYAKENQTNKSDIDICIVAPNEDNYQIYTFLSANLNIVAKKYDIKFFRDLPLYLKIQIIEEGIVIFSRDELDLYEYFYPYRKLWADQKHRQELSKEELLSLID